jgi:hypothetical protein
VRQILVKATDEYFEWADRLAARLRKAGHPVESRADLVEMGLAALAAQHGLPPAPPRANPVGTNRFGLPRDAAPPPTPKRRGRPRKSSA